MLCFALLIIADMQRTNRVLIEETLERLKDVQYKPGAADGVVQEDLGATRGAGL
jgi:hypothetical protein